MERNTCKQLTRWQWKCEEYDANQQQRLPTFKVKVATLKKLGMLVTMGRHNFYCEDKYSSLCDTFSRQLEVARISPVIVCICDWGLKKPNWPSSYQGEMDLMSAGRSVIVDFFFFFGFRFDSELSFFWLMLPNVHRPANTEELQLNSFIQHHLTCYGLTTQRVSGEVVALLDYQTGMSVWPKLMKDSNLAQWIVLHSVEFLGFAD